MPCIEAGPSHRRSCSTRGHFLAALSSDSSVWRNWIREGPDAGTGARCASLAVTRVLAGDRCLTLGRLACCRVVFPGSGGNWCRPTARLRGRPGGLVHGLVDGLARCRQRPSRQSAGRPIDSSDDPVRLLSEAPPCVDVPPCDRFLLFGWVIPAVLREMEMASPFSAGAGAPR